MLDSEEVAEKEKVRKRAASVKMELPHNIYYRKDDRFRMNSITQEMKYRQSLICYAATYGVSRASRKYNRS